MEELDSSDPSHSEFSAILQLVPHLQNWTANSFSDFFTKCYPKSKIDLAALTKEPFWANLPNYKAMPWLTKVVGYDAGAKETMSLTLSITHSGKTGANPLVTIIKDSAVLTAVKTVVQAKDPLHATSGSVFKAHVLVVACSIELLFQKAETLRRVEELNQKSHSSLEVITNLETILEKKTSEALFNFWKNDSTKDVIANRINSSIEDRFDKLTVDHQRLHDAIEEQKQQTFDLVSQLLTCIDDLLASYNCSKCSRKNLLCDICKKPQDQRLSPKPQIDVSKVVIAQSNSSTSSINTSTNTSINTSSNSLTLLAQERNKRRFTSSSDFNEI